MNAFLINKAYACTPRIDFDTGEVLNPNGCDNINSSRISIDQSIKNTYQENPVIFFSGVAIILLLVFLIVHISIRIFKNRKQV